MFLREVKRQNKNGTTARYLQLVENSWDAGASHTKIVYSFGRSDELDRTMIERLVGSLSRLLDPATAPAATAGTGLSYLESRPLGGAHALDGVWRRLRIDKTMAKLLDGRRFNPRAERVLFALVANRALKASSKLAATSWVNHDVHIEGLPAVEDDTCYRAMDWLLDIEDDLTEQVYRQVADLLNLEVDLLFFDTTSTYFETGEPDESIARDEHGHPTSNDAVRDAGFRSYGKSKDHRDDLPQIVIGMAVTRGGIPIRVWSWPGATNDSALIRQVKDDLRAWTLARVVWVADRGFASAENRRYLQRAGGHYIIGEKLRCGSEEVKLALSRQGRYATVAGNLQVKEVKIEDAGDRFVICYNPDQATRDKAIREQLIGALTEKIGKSDQLGATKRGQLRGVLSTKSGLNRFLRVTPKGLLRIDSAEERLDGKYLLRSSDPKLSPEDIAVGYKQLLEVERGWRDMKQIIDLRPVYHRKEERIRAHVLLCWLALLLIRIIETSCDDTWNNLRSELDRLAVGTFAGPAGTFRQRTELTKPQIDILAKLGIPQPPKIIELTAPTTHA